jgi:hypothetical protein
MASSQVPICWPEPLRCWAFSFTFSWTPPLARSSGTQAPHATRHFHKVDSEPTARLHLWFDRRRRRPTRLRQAPRPSSAFSSASTHQVLPCLLFPSCFASPSAKHPNPNYLAIGYLMPTTNILAKEKGTPMFLYCVRPCSAHLMICCWVGVI